MAPWGALYYQFCTRHAVGAAMIQIGLQEPEELREKYKRKYQRGFVCFLQRKSGWNQDACDIGFRAPFLSFVAKNVAAVSYRTGFFVTVGARTPFL